MNWLYYLLEANLYLAIFYALYLLLLRNETFYTANRWYLISTSVIAFLLPFMQIGWLKPAETAAQVVSVATTPTVVPTINFQQVAPVSNPVAINLANVLSGIYVLGVVIALVLFGIKLFKLYRIISNSKKINSVHCDLIELEDENTGFSFFNYLFIGKNLHNRHTIIAHEMVHIGQKHSADIVFTELLKMVNWFNPVVYMLQNSLKTVHEYIADEFTATTETDNITYSSFLLNSAYGLQGPAATNSFFNANLLKNRIVMLNKPRSGSAARLKYLMAIPITAGTLCLSTLSFSKDYPTFDLYSGGEATKAEINLLTTELHQADTGLRIPAPTVVKNDFTALTTYLGKHIKFPASEINKTKFAGLSVSFDVDKSGGVGDVRLLAPAKNVFGNAAVSAFHKFSGKLKVEPGTYIIGVNFVTLANDYVRFRKSSLTKNANFICTVTITGLTSKQAKDLNIRAQPGTPPKIEKTKVAQVVKQQDDFSAFYAYIAKHSRYPRVELENKVTGRTLFKLVLNADNTIKDVIVLRSPNEALSKEIARAILTYKDPLPAKPNADYTIPVSYQIMMPDDKIFFEPSGPKDASNADKKESLYIIEKSDKTNYSLNEVVITAYYPKS
ncbi:M56 family metallopeptidase [Mucilaginibacter defluvii]|uniref:TonB C-terminal domain-containing protein n=1 Tax=Mucilaginibacter defluvii TaxID=1196019 RepID=A0ABP9FMP0_9SPHI